MIIFILFNGLMLNSVQVFIDKLKQGRVQDEIKKIKGKISNNMDGALIRVNIKGNRVFTSHL